MSCTKSQIYLFLWAASHVLNSVWRPWKYSRQPSFTLLYLSHSHDTFVKTRINTGIIHAINHNGNKFLKRHPFHLYRLEAISGAKTKSVNKRGPCCSNYLGNHPGFFPSHLCTYLHQSYPSRYHSHVHALLQPLYPPRFIAGLLARETAHVPLNCLR